MCYSVWGFVYLYPGHAKCLLPDKRTAPHFLFTQTAARELLRQQNLPTMKKLFHLVVVTLLLTSCGSRDVCKYMDDAVFRLFCYELFDLNKDGAVTKDEAKLVKYLDLAESGVTSLKGIENFENLELFRVSECKNLRSVDLRKCKKLIGIMGNAFWDCSELSSIELPETITVIGEDAFCDTKIQSIRLPKGLQRINNGAFSFSPLKSIDIPDNVQLETGAFWACDSLRTFQGKFASADGRCLIDESGMLLAFAPAGLTAYELPDNVKIIGEETNLDNLESLVLPSTIEQIQKHAFGYYPSMSIYCKATTPPVFDAHDKCKWLKIFVPASDDDSIINAYRSAETWNQYSESIFEYDFNN